MESAKRAVIAVGDGRGFVVEGRGEKLCVITAAHCLPHLPPPDPASNCHVVGMALLVKPQRKKARRRESALSNDWPYLEEAER